MKCKTCDEEQNLYLHYGSLYCLWCFPTEELDTTRHLQIAQERNKRVLQQVREGRERRRVTRPPPAKAKGCGLRNGSRSHPENSSNRSDGIATAASAHLLR